MAQQISRGNLSAARFPLVSTLMGRSIILPQHDMNYVKNAVFSGGDQDKDIGVPQIYYCHNVMPTEQGYQSVGFSQVVAPITGATDFDQAIGIADFSGNKYIYVPAAGKNYIFDAPNLSWASYSSISGLPNNVLTTTAFVQGVQYIFYANNGCYMYNNVTKNFDPVVLNGLVVANIVGIVGANGYLLAWDINGILYWSSAVTPTDFVPSLVTGASSGNITDLKGRVVVILPANNGFIVYATQNAVGGTFTGNLRFPFNLKEIPGSGGLRDKEHVSYESNLDEHYALTSAGLQQLSKTASKTLFAELADFLTSRIFEDYDDTTKLFTTSYTTGDLKIKLTVVGSRYFVISYGVFSFTHALIHDLVQKKWGKVRIDHVDAFQFTAPNLYGSITYAMLEALGTTYDDLIDTMYQDLDSSVASAERPRRNIGFLQADGTVKVISFDLADVTHSAVFLIGRYQFVRQDYLQLFGFEIENINANSNFAAFVLPSYDGKNFAAPVVPVLHTNAGPLREYRCRVTAQNQSLLFTGSFNFCSLLIRYTNAGKIR